MWEPTISKVKESVLDCSTLKDEGNMFFSNSGNHLPNHTALHPTRPKSLTTPPSEFQTLQPHVLFICTLDLVICDFSVFQKVTSNQLWFHIFFHESNVFGLHSLFFQFQFYLLQFILPQLYKTRLFILNPSALLYTFLLLPFFTLLLSH